MCWIILPANDTNTSHIYIHFFKGSITSLKQLSPVVFTNTHKQEYNVNLLWIILNGGLTHTCTTA